MINVEGFSVSGGMDLAPEQGLHVAVPQTGEAGEQERPLHDVKAAWGADQDFQFLDRKELSSGCPDLRLFLGVQRTEWVVGYHALYDGFIHRCGDPVHQQPGRGVTQRLISPVGLAGPQESDEAPAELPVHLRKTQVRLPDGGQVFLDPHLRVPLADHA